MHMDPVSSSPRKSSSVPAIVYVFSILGVLVILGTAALFAYGIQMFRLYGTKGAITLGNQFSSPEAAERFLPTDFVQIGTLRFPKPANPTVSEAVLEYVGVDKATTTIPVVFDWLTICAAENGAVPCMAMSMTYDAAFGEKRVTIEGIRMDEHVLIRKLHAYAPTDGIVPPVPGIIFVDWPEVVSAFNTCKVKAISENSTERTVQLNFWKSPETWESLQPLKGSLYAAMEAAEKNCGPLSGLLGS